ncbi:polysaccharide deacetylase family protein [Prolixibacter bellariivorans]|nr:polysaccharide deacetylase [Prolixibacter bellariivorans]
MEQVFDKKSRSFLFAGLLMMMLFVHGNAKAAALSKISNYKAWYGAGDYLQKQVIIIRKYDQSGQPFYIGVDPNSLETMIVPGRHILVRPLSWPQIRVNYKNTPYIRAIQSAEKQSFALQDAGIIHGFPEEKGITLTVDLCPSHRPLDRVIFTSLISEFAKTEKPVPVALSVTGRFMLTHPADIAWLKELNAEGDIAVTWINHTYNHHYNPHVPLTRNFLLEPNTNLNLEILQTEIAMLQKGLLFSVFFRFPGLVSEHRVVDHVLGYGLIPIGSDAWLAKGQPAAAGSIVLIHGNGNEPVGVKDFLKLLQTDRSAVMKKQWLLYDLRETVRDEFHE